MKNKNIPTQLPTKLEALLAKGAVDSLTLNAVQTQKVQQIMEEIEANGSLTPELAQRYLTELESAVGHLKDADRLNQMLKSLINKD